MTQPSSDRTDSTGGTRTTDTGGTRTTDASETDRTGDRTDRTDGRYTGIERRTIQGREVRVHQDPDELYIEWRPNRAVYIGVRTGDRIKDADRDVESVRIREWEVTEITPERVVGRDVRTGEPREWEREALERGLVLGTYATNLSDFALVTAYPIGSWEEYDEASVDREDVTYHGRPYLTVVVYGNNGEKYGLRYRFAEVGNRTDVEPWEEDLAVQRLSPELRDRLDERVRAALADDGYAIRE